ncbi:MAG: pyridoxine 5-phosphate synthase [Glaciecola sp.]|jgi:pyridoxine 5-phosphate synthase
MTKLSVNINKVATLRNARGGNVPDLVKVALDCERYGAQGITVHPRPDERHVRYQDVRDLKKVLTTELNIEGYPSDDFINMVLEVKPAQVTLVPDPPEAITSNAGWDVVGNKEFLTKVVGLFKQENIRVSLFTGTDLHQIIAAKEVGTDRVELYTESYAKGYSENKELAVTAFVKASIKAKELNLELNAGHDLSLENLSYFADQLVNLKEVSIGHALIADALYLGLNTTIKAYLSCLKK